MNVYDFDETIFFPDSSYLFVRWCLRRYPKAVLRALPATTATLLLHVIGKKEMRDVKEKIFSFLPYLDDVDGIVERFWEENFDVGIASWYLRQRRDDDVILSASPEFLLRPAIERLGVTLIATRMDRHTGEILGKNCHDYDKVTRFYQMFPNEHPERFYSDSLSDSPMARIADAAWIVEDAETLVPWPDSRGGLR